MCIFIWLTGTLVLSCTDPGQDPFNVTALRSTLVVAGVSACVYTIMQCKV